MADPISLSGTMAGIVTLGIQVFHSLVEYCKAVDRYPEEVHLLIAYAGHRQANLKLLRKRLLASSISHCEATAQIRKCVDRADVAFRNLDKKINEYSKKSQTNGVKEKSRNFIQTARWPFRRKIIQDLRSRVDDIGQILREAEGLLHL